MVFNGGEIVDAVVSRVDFCVIFEITVILYSGILIKMSSRGRGYGGYSGRSNYSGGRGGYRGSYRGSNTRGSYESRGRGGGYSYNSDTRYTTAPRYTNRDRPEESYKKPYRSDTSASYSSRDYSGRSGSPERKRMRMEGSSSDRRSHDGGGHYGGSYSARQESYGGERRSFSGEERRRSPARDSYRKSGGMGPPAPRDHVRTRAPRRSFRGRTLRSRASYRGAPRSRGTYAPRRFSDRSLAYTRPYKTIKRSSIKSKDEASSTEEEWEADDKEETTEEKKELKIKEEVTAEVSEAEAEADAAEETDKEADAASDAPPPRARTYVHLACVHCKEKHATFAGYAKHLMSMKHRAAMSGVARRHKAALLRMRVAQRGAQRELEAAAAAGELAARTTFCLVCRLNHRTTRHVHNLTDTHRAMKRFLMPFCRTCRLAFRSPMIYEHHICSLEHLKRKAGQGVRRAASPKVEASGDEGMDVDLDNFMTLDSVGDVDEVEDDDSGGEKKDEAAPKKIKVEINIGSEHIKKLEVYWCELCRVYLPRAEAAGEQAEALRRHCRLRIHLGRYVQHRDTRTLRKHAERIHRQLHQQKEEEKEAAAAEGADKAAEEKDENVAEQNKKLENGTDTATASGNDDKLWADVDKDIGEFLREVDPQGNEGSDDEEDHSRYDKFRKSDKKTKNGDGEENETAATEAAVETNNTEINTAA